VGDDRVIPMARMTDDTALLPESAYVTGAAPALRATTRVGAALAADMYLSDDPLGVLDPVSPGDLPGALFVPDLALGRLVETPAEITSVVATFIAQDGVLDLSTVDPDLGHKVLLTGYDFLTSVATQARKRWKAALGVDTPAGSLAPVDGSLIGSSWGHGDPTARAAELRAHLAGNGGERYAVVSLNGHASHWEEGVPGTDPQDISGLGSLELYGNDACHPAPPELPSLAFEGAFVYALGCHGGLSVPGSCAGDADNSLDLPQTFLSRGAVAYLGNTGYGWGLRNGIGYSARLTQLLTEELTSGGTRVVGESVLRAKRRYVLESPRFDPYDLKVLMQWTTFGLPMYAVRTGIGETASREARPEPKPGETMTEALGPVLVEKTLRTATAAPDLAARAEGEALPPYLTQLNLRFDLSGPGVYRKHDSLGDDLEALPGCPDPDGCYYTLNGLVDRGSGAADLPIQPYLVYDSRLSGTSQHGVLWKGGTYVEDPDFRFVVATLVSNAAPSTDHGSTPRMAIIRPTEQRLVVGPDSPGCRPSDLELNSLTVAGGEAGKVHDTDPAFTINRLYRSVTLEALYFNDTVTPTNNCDRTGPSIGSGPYGGQYHRVSGAGLEWAVSPPEAVWRVLVVHNNNSVDALGEGSWIPLELEDDGTGTFRGRADLTPGRRVTYVIQAVDHRGNVTWLDYQATELPDSGVPLGIPQPTDVVMPVLPPVVVAGMSPTSGPVGTMVTLTGTGFTGATAVRLAGTSSSFQVLSDTLLVFFVPPEAASGTAQVTGPGGTGTSAGNFTVTWPSLSVGDVIVPLGPGPTTASFPVTLAGTRILPVTVAWATQDGSAVAGTDYLAGSGVLELPPGTDAGTIDVDVLGVSPPSTTKSFQVLLSSPVNAELADPSATGTLLGTGGGTKLATLPPCRVIDTRIGTGPLAGPPLEPYPARRVFVLTGTCGIPAGAKAVVANITVAAPASSGDLRIYPGDLSSLDAGPSSAISFTAGKTRANNALIKLAPDGSIAVENNSGATADFILDVAGIFQ
jgi:hypothetical protein